MPTFASYDHGTPCWVDLMSPDIESSTAFYSGLFGWDAEDQDDGEGNRIYTMFSLNGQTVAGLGGQPPEMAGAPAVWSNYVTVDDLEATLAKVEPAGGKIMMPAMQVMDAGSMAFIQDPSGAALALWQADQHIGCQVCNEPNTFTWSELMSRGLDEAQPFYAAVLGWEYEAVEMSNGPYHVVQGGDNDGLAGMMAMPEMVAAEVPDHWTAYFNVSDAAATAARALELGGTLVNGPMETPVGQIATIADPQGGMFSIMQPAEPAEG